VKEKLKIAFLPAGEMNTALALKAQKNGHQATVWFYTDKSYRHFQQTGQSPRLKGIDLPGIKGTHDIEEALDGVDVVSFAPRSKDFRKTVQDAAPFIGRDTIILTATKGFDQHEGEYFLPSEVISQEVKDAQNRIVVLSGPNFAEQLAKGKITGTTVAAFDSKVGQQVGEIFDNGLFWVDLYKGTDPRDVERIGAFKNVVGLVMGFARTTEDYDENTGGFILQKGLEEAALLCRAMGGDDRAIMELCGIGDYGLLMNSRTSRNVEAGEDFGRGTKTLEDLINSSDTIEGVRTVKAVRALSLKHKVFMPLTRIVYKVLYENMDPAYAIRRLFFRKVPFLRQANLQLASTPL